MNQNEFDTNSIVDNKNEYNSIKNKRDSSLNNSVNEEENINKLTEDEIYENRCATASLDETSFCMENINSEYFEEQNDKIFCIELMNNNKVYINYDSEWTLRDVLNSLQRHKEFIKLYSLKDYLYNSKFLNNAFDFKLIIYRSSKEKDEKVDMNIKIKDLENLGFLNRHRFPFLYLHDSRNFNSISENKHFLNSFYEISIKTKNYKVLAHQDRLYKDFLPRNFISYYPTNNSIEATDFYSINKKCLNRFNKIVLDPLIEESSGAKNSDWFVYDDESMNFLMKMENHEFKVDSNIKLINHKVYFQDKLPFIKLSNKQVKQIFINVNLNSEIKMKIDVNLTTTCKEILLKMNQKLKVSYPDLVFDPEIKILKVHSLSDYIFDLEEPIGLFTYLNQCIQNNTIAEYIVIDSPYFSKEMRFKESVFPVRPKLDKRRSSSLKNLIKFQNQNIFLSNDQKAHFNNLPSTKRAPYQKIADNKINNIPTYIGSVFLKSVPNVTKSNVPIFKKNVTPFKPPSEIVIKKEENIIKNKKGFENIATVDENNSEFLELREKRIKSLNSILRDEKLSESESTFIDFLIQKSNGKKVKKDKEQVKLFQVDVDELIKDNKRSRSKGIRENSQNKKRQESRNKLFDKNSKENFVVREKNNLSTHPNLSQKFSKYENYISQMNYSIRIRNIIRLFNIKLHMLQINIDFLKTNSSIFDNKHIKQNKSNSSSLEITMQLFCGREPISHEVCLSQTISPEKDLINIPLNFMVAFNVKYCDLPLFSNIIIKIKSFVLDKRKTIAWVNFRLFDHLKRLKTGKHKISFWDSKFSDDSYFSSVDNHKTNTVNILFELESFMRPVEHQEFSNLDEDEDEYENYRIKNRHKESSILPSDDKVIDNVLKKNLFEEITNEEKEVLWRNRYTLINNKDMICKLFRSVNTKDVNKVEEIEKLTQISKHVIPIQALQLLNGNFLNESVRKFAVESLEQYSYSDISDYLIQLVQSLKYEIYHDSPLARYLLKLAIKHPLTIGHSLFWNFKSEMYNTNIRQRFGLYLEIFLSKIGDDLRKIFEDEVLLIKNLLEVSDIAFINKNITKEEIKSTLENKLDKIHDNLFIDREISIPYNYKIKVKGIIVEKCKFMKSKKKPLWLVFENTCDLADDVYVMFKKGDDLRQDVITLQLFKIMNKLWFEEDIKLKMSNYEVISTGYYQGLLQIVTHSETLATIQKEYGGILSAFSNKPLKNWMCKIITNITEKEYVNNFVLSTVAYCIATFVLGIGDRHNDNIMVKKNGELFHIDFGHFLGHFKYKYGIKRERAPFIFTSEFCNVIGGEKSENFELFKSLCIDAYKIIRKNANIIITMLNSMLSSGVPELNCNSIKFLEYSLALEKNDLEAENFLLEKLRESLNSFSTKLNFAIHIMANK